MYNRYIGNTGQFIRMEDHPRVNAHNAERSAVKPPPTEHSVPALVHSEQQHSAPARKAEHAHPQAITKNKSLFGGLGGGLNNLLSGLGGPGGGLGGLTSGFKGMFDHLPFGLDLGDILLLLLLLFFFIESGDEEFIIILGVIAYSIFKER